MKKSQEGAELSEVEIKAVFQKLGLPLEAKPLIFTPVDQYVNHAQWSETVYSLRLSNNSKLLSNEG